ncbi:hypothetical protein HYT24_00915 [Candidatus Pacearchaeota archaeon]|nr:hypothetical protein [Candidatus Pacearchaeota archaeon]
MDILTITLAVIFIFGIVISYFAGQKIAEIRRDSHWESQIPIHRQDAIMKSRAVLSGQFSEQLAPYLPDFPYKPTECRFLGKPVDFIVFKGSDEKNIDEIVFVEVKSRNSKLSEKEKSLKNAIEKKKVRFEEYRVPGDLVDGD